MPNITKSVRQTINEIECHFPVSIKKNNKFCNKLNDKAGELMFICSITRRRQGTKMIAVSLLKPSYKTITQVTLNQHMMYKVENRNLKISSKDYMNIVLVIEEWIDNDAKSKIKKGDNK